MLRLIVRKKQGRRPWVTMQGLLPAQGAPSRTLRNFKNCVLLLRFTKAYTCKLLALQSLSAFGRVACLTMAQRFHHGRVTAALPNQTKESWLVHYEKAALAPLRVRIRKWRRAGSLELALPYFLWRCHMRNVVRALLAVAVVAVSGQVSWAQAWRDAGSKITGNYNGVYSATPRTYRSYSYVAPRAAVTNAPAVVNAAPRTTNTAPRATAVAPTPARQPAVVAAPPVRTQAAAPTQTQQAQSQVRVRRNYSYQPSAQPFSYSPGYRTMAPNGYRTRADSKVLAD